MAELKRQTAYHVWISDIQLNKYVKQEGVWESNYIVINNKQVSRVNLIATVISKFISEDRTYVSIILDDGSASIKVKAWREDTEILQSLEQGQIINLIGKLREFNDEKYIVPEIIKKVNSNWELLRKLQLLKQGKPKIFTEKAISSLEQTSQKVETIEEIFEEISNETIQENIKDIEETPREKIFNIIEKLDSPEGVEIEKIIQESEIEESKVDILIEDLIKEGEIFQPQTGKLKIMK